MSKEYSNKRKYSKDEKTYHPFKRLSDVDHMTIERHINTVYVGTTIRLLDSYNNGQGKLATAHWIDNRGVFVTYHSEEISTFVDLRDKTFVVDHGSVKPGSFLLFSKLGTDDMEDDNKKKLLMKLNNRTEEY